MLITADGWGRTGRDEITVGVPAAGAAIGGVLAAAAATTSGGALACARCQAAFATATSGGAKMPWPKQ